LCALVLKQTDQVVEPIVKEKAFTKGNRTRDRNRTPVVCRFPETRVIEKVKTLENVVVGVSVDEENRALEIR
jgi:hypothetical protein